VFLVCLTVMAYLSLDPSLPAHRYLSPIPSAVWLDPYSNLYEWFKASSRRLIEMHMPPTNGEFTDYSGPFLHTVQHSSGPHTFKSVVEVLKQSDEKFKPLDSLLSSASSVDPSLLAAAVELLYSANKSLFDGQPSRFVSRLVRDPDWADLAQSSETDEKRLWYRAFEHRRIQDVFDVVLAIGCETKANEQSLNAFMGSWRPILEPLHLIIVQSDGCDSRVAVAQLPSWTDYDFFTPADVTAHIPPDHRWIFNNSHGADFSKVFGAMLADRDFVYFLDRNSLPGDAAYPPCY
jgi:Reversibly glycosylated polypeptide